MEKLRQILEQLGAGKVILATELVLEKNGAPVHLAPLAVVIVTFTLMFAVLIIVTALGAGSGASAKKKGKKVLLLGQSGAGKTALFYRLYDNQFPECVTSLEPSEKTFTIAQDESAEPKPLTVVDFPGHARLRAMMAEKIHEAACIIYLVDAADKSSAMLTETSELLYDIFVECIRFGCEPRVLIACNKSDLTGSADLSTIKAKLEAALESLKSTRHSLQTEGDEGMEIILGTEGATFSFENDAGCDVEFCKISVKKGGESIAPVVDFLADVFA